MRDARQDLIDAIKPFLVCKVHNPNRSHQLHTTRVISPKAIDLVQLRIIYRQLQLADAVHLIRGVPNGDT